MGTNESKLTSADYRSAANKVRKALLEIDLGADIEHLAMLGVAHMEAEADRLDTEERTDTESFSFLNELAGAFRSGEKHARPQHTPVLEGVRAVLAHLTAAGRLVPAGGMALTAEQVEGVRIAREALRGYRNFDGNARGRVNRLIAAVGALFPATEPAEDSVGDPLQAWKGFLKPKPIGWYRTMELDFAAEHFGFPVKPDSGDWFTASDGGKWCSESNEWELRYYPPAPAEPAEEETKAEYPHRGLGDLNVLGPEIFTNGEVINWRGENFVRAEDDGVCSAKFDGDRVYRCALADEHYGDHTTAKGEHWQKRPASSPVVPATTETGPWQTWQEVPEGVKYWPKKKDFRLCKRVNIGGVRHLVNSDGTTEVAQGSAKSTNDLAPFVAVNQP